MWKFKKIFCNSYFTWNNLSDDKVSKCHFYIYIFWDSEFKVWKICPLKWSKLKLVVLVILTLTKLISRKISLAGKSSIFHTVYWHQESINSQNKKAYLDACNSCWLSTVLDGQLVNAGPFVLQEALFKNDLDLTFGDSQLWLQYYNFLTIFSA